MFEKLKANVVFNKLLGRPNIDKAYKMVPPTDSWYDTITTVHNSLAKIHELPHEVVQITSHDNLTMKGIYYPAENPSNVTVIWVHGYTSHAERESAFPGLFYHNLCYNFLVPYLRAHALSQGKYISFGALEQRDISAWVNKVNQLVPNGKIVLHGLSMGGGTVLMASNKTMQNVKCIIADAPSVGVEGLFQYVARESFKKDADKIVELLFKRYKKEFAVEASDCNIFKYVGDCKFPLLLSAGSNERLEELFDSIQKVCPATTDTIILPGCNHGNGMYKQTQLYQGKIVEFLNNNL